MNFDDCTYYDCDDAETLTHETPEDALRARIDVVCDPKQPLAPQILAMGAVTVTGYVREQVDSQWMANRARVIVEDLLESWDEEYGPSDDSTDLPAPLASLLDHAAGVVVGILVQRQPVWRSKPASTRIYTAEEVLALMREHEPKWFE